jgi:hypothetical protein
MAGVSPFAAVWVASPGGVAPFTVAWSVVTGAVAVERSESFRKAGEVSTTPQDEGPRRDR